jgi:putative ABC transport system substrate-binding protein
VDALYISGEPLLYNNMAKVLPFAMASGKPTVGTYPDWGRAGLLMSYSADLLDDFRRAGIYAAKILGGEKPGDLPIEQATSLHWSSTPGPQNSLASMCHLRCLRWPTK